MASNWGQAWGSAWGSAWGDPVAEDAWSDHWADKWGVSWGHTGASTPAPATPTTSVGGGRRRQPKREWYIEVDGQWFTVQNAQHARDLLARARQLAKERAAEIAKPAPAPPKPKIKAPQALKARAPAFARELEQAQAFIAEQYRLAWEAAREEEEIAAVLTAVEDFEAQIIAAIVVN